MPKPTHQFGAYRRSELLDTTPHARASRYQKNAHYSTQSWLRLTRRIRKHEPFCSLCLILNRTTLSESVDHIDGDTANECRDNLLALCNGCHSYKTHRLERQCGVGGEREHHMGVDTLAAYTANDTTYLNDMHATARLLLLIECVTGHPVSETARPASHSELPTTLAAMRQRMPSQLTTLASILPHFVVYHVVDFNW